VVALALEDEDDAKIVEALNEQYEIQKRTGCGA